jgi:HD domain
MLLTEIATLDALLNAHGVELGSNFTAYRNHTYRVANLCVALSSDDSEQRQKIAIAAAFHDMGIWTDGTFDYLQPSIRLASAHLARSGRAEWTSEITEMILQHHKISPSRGDRHWLIEPFRQADWVDVSRGLVTFGLPRKFLHEIFSAWPGEGFHKRLAQLSLERLRTHPWSPLPMVRL